MNRGWSTRDSTSLTKARTHVRAPGRSWPALLAELEAAVATAASKRKPRACLARRPDPPRGSRPAHGSRANPGCDLELRPRAAAPDLT